MSDIDKALPNVVENTVTTPSEEEVALAEEQIAESQGGEGVDILENEDGGHTYIAINKIIAIWPRK